MKYFLTLGISIFFVFSLNGQCDRGINGGGLGIPGLCNGDMYCNNPVITVLQLLGAYRHNDPCDTICNGEASVEPATGFYPYSYLWSTGATDSLIAGLCSGIYSCTVTDLMGDTGSVDITIIDSSRINTGSINGPVSSQQGDTSTYSVNNNTGSYYYWFITGGTLVSSPFSYSVSVVWDSLGQCSIGTYETDSNNCVGDSVLLDVSVGAITALKKTDKALTYIYPNPFSESTVIEFDNSAGEVFELYVFDMASRLIKHLKGITGNRYEFRRDGISDGIYFVELRSPNKTYMGKLMIE